MAVTKSFYVTWYFLISVFLSLIWKLPLYLRIVKLHVWLRDLSYYIKVASLLQSSLWVSPWEGHLSTTCYVGPGSEAVWCFLLWLCRREWLSGFMSKQAPTVDGEKMSRSLCGTTHVTSLDILVPKAGTRSYLRHRLNKAFMELEVSFQQNISLAQKANKTGGQTQKSHLVETLLQCFQQDSLDEWSAAQQWWGLSPDSPCSPQAIRTTN